MIKTGLYLTNQKYIDEHKCVCKGYMFEYEYEWPAWHDPELYKFP